MRYVVLHHTGWGEPHFDLLLEVSADGLLDSWRLSDWPPNPGTVAVRNTPHRRLYLDYEGPVSGDRGTVKRLTGGIYTVVAEKPCRAILKLDGIPLPVELAEKDD